MFSASIRLKLTLWYAVTLVVVLGISGGFWYVHLSNTLLRQLDQRLWCVAGEAGSLRGLLQAEGPVDCSAVTNFACRYRLGETWRLVDAAGVPLCDPGGESARLPLPERWMLDAALFDGAVIGTEHDAGRRSLRQLVLALETGESGRVFLQTGVDLEAVEHPLKEMRKLLLWFGPLALLVVCVAGWFLAGRVLAPVENITRAMRRINAENLNQRLPIGKARDEISRLAETFNSMLSRLEESFRKVAQFSGDASHELRTPLTILKGETEVALRWAKNPDEFRKMLESSMEEIDRMGRIIEDLLILAKSDSGRKSLEIKELSLSDLLQELYLQAKTLGEPKKIQTLLRLNVTEEIRILGDELRLRQLFLNLISNAVKYTPEGGRVEITLSTKSGQAIVSVADTGIGIPAEHLPHIFDRFYRIDKARNREAGGTGLGLAIVHSLAQAHDGRIMVASMPGEGSTFTVYLPIEGPSAQTVSRDVRL